MRLFDTPIGPMAIAWSERGVTAVQLPEATPEATLERIAARTGPAAGAASCPAFVEEAITLLVRHLAGEVVDLSGIPLDDAALPDFKQRVYRAARAIPSGATATYGEIAARAGSPGGARAAGQALGKNPFPIIVPCHRVTASDGKLGGFTAHGGLETKLKLLEVEKARLPLSTPLVGEAPRGASRSRLSFDWDEAVRVLSERDPKMAEHIAASRPVRLEPKPLPSVFEALAEAIVYQQLTGKAAATIFARVVKIARTPEEVAAASDDDLRAAGLSRPKLLSLRDLAQRAAAGELPSVQRLRAMDDDAIVESLTHIRGIGRWTVEMMLIFRLGRPDVLPVGDYGIRKGYAKLYRKRDLPDPKALAKAGKRWAPYRTVASWYLWRALDPEGPAVV